MLCYSDLVTLDGHPGDVRGAEAVVHHVARVRVLARLPRHRVLQQRGQLRPHLGYHGMVNLPSMFCHC